MKTTGTNNGKYSLLKIAEITIGSTNPRKEFDKEAIAELADSIKVNGVIQPIVVRPGKKKGYELVCGERRYRASVIAKRTDIPAIVRELTDDQMLELQVTENLQRKDIHPMDEAVAFKHWQSMDPKKWSIPAIALRVGKSEKYVAFRLKLNSLIPEFQKLVYKGEMDMRTALAIVKLGEESQRRMQKEERWGINENTVRKYSGDLKNALFDITDANLKKDMGACSKCQFNTHNSLLFADDKDPRCGLLSCYTQKVNLTFDAQVKKALATEGVVLMSNDYSLGEAAKHLQKQGHKVYNRNQLDTWSVKKGDKGAMKAFVIEGSDRGKYKWVKEEKRSNNGDKGGLTSDEVNDLIKKGKASSAIIQGEIKKIQERQERAKQIDEENIAFEMYKALEEAEEKKPAIYVNAAELKHFEDAALAIFLIEHLGWAVDMLAPMNLDGMEDYEMYPVLLKMESVKLHGVIRVLLRGVILNNFSCNNKGSRPDNSAHVLVIEDIMKSNFPAKAKEIRTAWEEKGKVRGARAALKIEKLQLAKKAAKK